MTPSKLFVAALLCGLASPGFACTNPPLVQVPNKNVSDGDRQRITAAVGAYFEAMKAYTSCLQAELAAAGGDSAAPLMKSAYVVRNNGAVAEVEAVLKVFNANIGPVEAAGPPQPAPPQESGSGSRSRDRNN